MSSFSGLVSAGYLLNRFATKARLSLGFPLTTSAGVTNCRQPSLSACCSMASALFMSSFSWTTQKSTRSDQRHRLSQCGGGAASVGCQRAYAEACHVDVNAWVIFIFAFWRDLIQEVEVGSRVLKNRENNQTSTKEQTRQSAVWERSYLAELQVKCWYAWHCLWATINVNISFGILFFAFLNGVI